MKIMMMPAEVWIVILNFNGTADTIRCLQSLDRLVDRDAARVLVVDNHSTPDPVPALEQRFPGITYIRTQDNLGFAGGSNVGIRHAVAQGARWVLLLNNDTVVAPNLVDRLVTEARDAGVAILGPRVNYLDEPETRMPTAFHVNRKGAARVFEEIADRDELIQEADTVMGCCLLVASDVFASVGLLDERYFLIHEESEFCLRAKQRGHRVAFLRELLVWHKGSSTFRREGLELVRYYDARNLWWLQRRARNGGPDHNGRLASIVAYWRYIQHMREYAAARGLHADVSALEDGFVDAFLLRGGKRPRPLRWARPVAHTAIELGWSVLWRLSPRG
jgi:GT2 family glycosyltransferase